MKLYLIKKELNLLSKKISYDTPVYISKNKLFTGFNKRNDGYLIPQVKQDSGEWYNSNLTALLNKLNAIAKLETAYHSYELVIPKSEPFIPAKFVYDRVNDLILLEEDKYPFAPNQFIRFCDFYNLRKEERELLTEFIGKNKIILNERFKKILKEALKSNLDFASPYLIPLLITQINKF